jgi:hypothetical protein
MIATSGMANAKGAPWDAPLGRFLFISSISILAIPVWLHTEFIEK